MHPDERPTGHRRFDIPLDHRVGFTPAPPKPRTITKEDLERLKEFLAGPLCEPFQQPAEPA